MTEVARGLRVWHHSARSNPGGPAVVFVHGSMDRSATFLRTLRHLEDRHAVRYDRRGYGRSRDAGSPVGVDGHARDLVAVIEGEIGAPVVVIGHSIGGVIALIAAGLRPDLVAAVGAYEAPMPWVPWWPKQSAGGAALARDGDAQGDVDTSGAAERFLRRMIGDERWDALPSMLQDERRAEGVALVAELVSIRGNPAYDLADIRCPVMAARGTIGRDHHRRSADELAAAVGQPGGAHVIEGADHGAHLSHVEAFARWVDRVAERAVAQKQGRD